MVSKKCPKCSSDIDSQSYIYYVCKKCKTMFNVFEDRFEEVYIQEVIKGNDEVNEEEECFYNTIENSNDYDGSHKELMLKENEYSENEYYWALRIKEYTHGFIRALKNYKEIRELSYCYKLYFSGQFLFEKSNEKLLKGYIQDSYNYYKDSILDCRNTEIEYEKNIQDDLDNIDSIEGKIIDLDNYIRPRKVYNSNFRKKFKAFYIIMIVFAALFVVGAISGCVIPFVDIEGKTKVWVIVAFIAFLIVDLLAILLTGILTALAKAIHKKKIKKDIASKQKKIKDIQKNLKEIREAALINHCRLYRTNKIIELFEENFENIMGGDD